MFSTSATTRTAFAVFGAVAVCAAVGAGVEEQTVAIGTGAIGAAADTTGAETHHSPSGSDTKG